MANKSFKLEGHIKEMKGIISLVPQIMAKKGFNNLDLAEALEVHRHTASPIAAGLKLPATPEKWTLLCDFLQVKPHEILVYVDTAEERAT